MEWSRLTVGIQGEGGAEVGTVIVIYIQYVGAVEPLACRLYLSGDLMTPVVVSRAHNGIAHGHEGLVKTSYLVAVSAGDLLVEPHLHHQLVAVLLLAQELQAGCYRHGMHHILGAGKNGEGQRILAAAVVVQSAEVRGDGIVEREQIAAVLQ